MTRSKAIVLSTNELPWRLGLEQLGALEPLRKLSLNRYPADTSPALRDALGAFCRCRPEWITVANGAAEVLDMTLAAIGNPGDRVLAAEPLFPLFTSLARVHHKDLVTMAAAPDLRVEAGQFLDSVERHRPRIVLLASPGNPSGLCLPAELISELLSRPACITILDEAYLEHADALQSWASRVGDYDNLIVVRTLSKLGLAGVRIGYAVAGSRLTRELQASGRRYRVGALSELVACALLERPEVIADMISRTRHERERVKGALRSIAGVHVLDSQANFNVVRLDGEWEYKEALRQQGIESYAFGFAGHRYLRITVGTPAEGNALLSVMERANPTVRDVDTILERNASGDPSDCTKPRAADAGN